MPSPLGRAQEARGRAHTALLRGRQALRKAARCGHGETQFPKVKSFETRNTNIQYASLTFIHPHPHTQFSDLICQLQIKFKTGFKFKTKFHDWFQTYQTISMQIAGETSQSLLFSYITSGKFPAHQKGKFLWCRRT